MHSENLIGITSFPTGQLKIANPSASNQHSQKKNLKKKYIFFIQYQVLVKFTSVTLSVTN